MIKIVIEFYYQDSNRVLLYFLSLQNYRRGVIRRIMGIATFGDNQEEICPWLAKRMGNLISRGANLHPGEPLNVVPIAFVFRAIFGESLGNDFKRTTTEFSVLRKFFLNNIDENELSFVRKNVLPDERLAVYFGFLSTGKQIYDKVSLCEANQIATNAVALYMRLIGLCRRETDAEAKRNNSVFLSKVEQWQTVKDIVYNCHDKMVIELEGDKHPMASPTRMLISLAIRMSLPEDNLMRVDMTFFKKLIKFIEGVVSPDLDWSKTDHQNFGKFVKDTGKEYRLRLFHEKSSIKFKYCSIFLENTTKSDSTPTVSETNASEFVESSTNSEAFVSESETLSEKEKEMNIAINSILPGNSILPNLNDYLTTQQQQQEEKPFTAELTNDVILELSDDEFTSLVNNSSFDDIADIEKTSINNLQQTSNIEKTSISNLQQKNNEVEHQDETEVEQQAETEVTEVESLSQPELDYEDVTETEPVSTVSVSKKRKIINETEPLSICKKDKISEDSDSDFSNSEFDNDNVKPPSTPTISVPQEKRKRQLKRKRAVNEVYTSGSGSSSDSESEKEDVGVPPLKKVTPNTQSSEVEVSFDTFFFHKLQEQISSSFDDYFSISITKLDKILSIAHTQQENVNEILNITKNVENMSNTNTICTAEINNNLTKVKKLVKTATIAQPVTAVVNPAAATGAAGPTTQRLESVSSDGSIINRPVLNNKQLTKYLKDTMNFVMKPMPTLKSESLSSISPKELPIPEAATEDSPCNIKFYNRVANRTSEQNARLEKRLKVLSPLEFNYFLLWLPQYKKNMNNSNQDPENMKIDDVVARCADHYMSERICYIANKLHTAINSDHKVSAAEEALYRSVDLLSQLCSGSKKKVFSLLQYKDKKSNADVMREALGVKALCVVCKERKANVGYFDPRKNTRPGKKGIFAKTIAVKFCGECANNEIEKVTKELPKGVTETNLFPISYQGESLTIRKTEKMVNSNSASNIIEKTETAAMKEQDDNDESSSSTTPFPTPSGSDTFLRKKKAAVSRNFASNMVARTPRR